MAMKLWLLWGLFFLFPSERAENPPLGKSACFAFADHDYIFTIEIVKPGVPILNFVSLADRDMNLLAKNIRLTLENGTVAAKVIGIEAGDRQQPIDRIALIMHPRSSFGVRVDGDFGRAKELAGAAIRLGDEDFKLVPMNGSDFDALVQKVESLNLRSPDISEDWRVLRLQPLGTRSPARKGSGADR
jgi:hypothetical protein